AADDHHGQCREHARDLAPVAEVDAERAEQSALALVVVVEHPLVPAVRDPVDAQPQPMPEGGSVAGGEALGDRAHVAWRATFDALRRNGAGGVDPQPAAAAEPDLGPGVG